MAASWSSNTKDKASHLYTDSQEKLAIGELWEKRSNGKSLFVIPTDREFGGLERRKKYLVHRNQWII